MDANSLKIPCKKTHKSLTTRCFPKSGKFPKPRHVPDSSLSATPESECSYLADSEKSHTNRTESCINSHSLGEHLACVYVKGGLFLLGDIAENSKES